MNTLVKRVLVSIVAIPCLLAVTYWTPALFTALTLVVLSLALLEYFRLADARKLKTLRVEGFVVLGLLLLPWTLPPMGSWDWRGAWVAGLMLLTLSFLWSRRPLKEMIISVSVTFFGAAYFGAFGGYFLRLRDMPTGALHLFWLFTATWAYDTGGYFAGKLWGRHHFAPLASPKKSVEGCLGGLLLTLGSLFLLRTAVPFYQGSYSSLDVWVLSFLFSFFGQMGDLVESLVKRSLSAKDSGSLIPGHGGVFDRIDSLLFNAPILFYYLTIFK